MAIWKMSQLKAPPQTDNAAELREYIKYLSNQLASMLKELDFVLNGQIDFRNVRAKSIKADNLSVDELSAISGNIGKVTSGEIYGAYIATREGEFPRAEINNEGDLLAVYTDADNYLTIEPGITGEPTVTFRKDDIVSLILGPAFGLTGLLANTSVVLGTQSGNTTIVCGPTGSIGLPSWEDVINVETAENLQDELDAKAVLGAQTETISGGSHNHGIPNGAQLLGADGVTVYTWSSYGGFTHSHTQT